MKNETEENIIKNSIDNIYFYTARYRDIQE